MSQSELLNKTVAALAAANTSYMLTGSFASSLQGEPRLTHDIDIVVALAPEAIAPLVNAFPPPEYYIDEIAISQAIQRQSQFNLVHVTTGDKVDFWLLTDDPFDQSRFARRYIEEFEGLRLHVSRPEDTIIMKLRWAMMSGGSEKQLNDARSVYELQKQSLDLQYIERWVKTIGVSELWKRLKTDVEQDD